MVLVIAVRLFPRHTAEWHAASWSFTSRCWKGNICVPWLCNRKTEMNIEMVGLVFPVAIL